jgi:glycosyltransferase involved in cell wall biosynthesis
MKSVAIFTNFSDYLASFSPLMIVEGQIKMFTEFGYKVRAIVSDGFIPPADSPFHMSEMVYIPNITNRSEDSRDDPGFDSDIDAVKEYLIDYLKDIDVCITHDMLFLPDYTKYNIAARAAADELPKLRWLHWIHSCTSIGTLQKERSILGNKYAEYAGRTFPNSCLVYPNSYDAPRIAKNLGFQENQVKVVPHPYDPTEFNKFESITKRLIDEKGLYEADVIMVYPLRMDRGKQPHVLVEVAAEIKRLGFSVRTIFVDFHSTGGDKVSYREEIKETATKLGLGGNDVTFTSEFDPTLEYEAPHGLVSDLLELSNVFLLPSRSETYSLVAQEAMAKGNLVILNQDFPPLLSVYQDYALYYKFSSNYDITAGRADATGETNTQYHPSSRSYYADMARRIIFEIEDNRVLAGQRYIRQTRNPKVVFREHLEPLLYAGDK